MEFLVQSALFEYKIEETDNEAAQRAEKHTFFFYNEFVEGADRTKTNPI